MFGGFLWGALGGTAPRIPLYADCEGGALDRIEARVTRDAGAGKMNGIGLGLLLGGDFSDEQRQRLAEIVSRCPIQRTLTDSVTITYH